MITKDYDVETGTWTNLKEYAKIALANNTTLIVDVVDSLFFTGNNGFGGLEQIEDFSNVILVGCGSKALGVNMGIMVTPYVGLRNYQKFYSPSLTFTNAIPPYASSMAEYNLRTFVWSKEGDHRRISALKNAEYLTNKLSDIGLKVLSSSNPIVSVKVKCGILAKIIFNMIQDHNVAISFLEYPDVQIGNACLIINVGAHHTTHDLDTLVQALQTVIPEAETYL